MSLRRTLLYSVFVLAITVLLTASVAECRVRQTILRIIFSRVSHILATVLWVADSRVIDTNTMVPSDDDLPTWDDVEDMLHWLPPFLRPVFTQQYSFKYLDCWDEVDLTRTECWDALDPSKYEIQRPSLINVGAQGESHVSNRKKRSSSQSKRQRLHIHR